MLRPAKCDQGEEPEVHEQDFGTCEDDDIKPGNVQDWINRTGEFACVDCLREGRPKGGLRLLYWGYYYNDKEVPLPFSKEDYAHFVRDSYLPASFLADSAHIYRQLSEYVALRSESIPTGNGNNIGQY